MKKKAIISLVLIALMAFGIGAGSYAWFTSQATSADNVFTAGTLEIEASKTVDFSKNIDNIYPGWSDSNIITIKNVGTLPLKFKVSMEASDSGLFKGANPLQMRINNGSWVNVSAFEDMIFDNPALEPEDTSDLDISYRLPEAANNTYQGAGGTLSFTIDATQTENPGWTEEYSPEP